MKTTTRTVLYGVAAAVALLVIGCTADDPYEFKYDGPSTPDLEINPDTLSGCPKVPTLPRPKLDVYPNPSRYAKQPFRGTCAGAATVIAEGGAGKFTANVGSTGKFCVEVTLIMDAPNNVKFSCLDARGCESPTTVISLNHKSMPKVDAGITVPVNLALKQPISSQPTPKAGSLSGVNDGQSGTFATFEFWDPEVSAGTCDKCAWVKVDLGKSYSVQEFKITWYQQKKYATCYTVLTSASAAPQNPVCNGANPGWQVATQEKVGDYKPQSIKINPAKARWAAFLMFENEGTGLWENFDIDEFEVWGRDPDATPPPPPDKCK